MELSTFWSLRDWLVAHTPLRNSRIQVEEKLLIFLFIVTRPASNRDAQERFAVGPGTVSRAFHEVLTALLLLYQTNVIIPDNTTPIAHRILDDYRYFPYFKDCLGALDGTHISAFVPVEDQPRYRNRKGTLSQNVLAVCDFDMRFLYILSG